MKQISAVLFLWSVVSAWAVAGATEIAVYPLHMETALPEATVNALKSSLQGQVYKILSEAVVANPVEVERYVQQKGEVSCWRDDGCIVALARTLQAKRVLLVSIVRTEPWIILSARVLGVDGRELRNVPVLVHTPKQDMSEDANFAEGFLELLDKLNLPELLRGRVEAPLPPPPQGLSGMRIASYTTMGVAAVGVVVGATFTVLYFDNQNKLNKLLDKDGASGSGKEEVSEALKCMQRVKDDRLYLIVGWSVAGASLATSLVLFFLSPERQQSDTAFSFVPLQGGGMLTFASSFP
ncbi:MAG: hypothetical protein FWD46_06560 [Cystobacterineae bacterium]|nr:hypothetical protein [Cystobacterineae bacterium]